MSKRDYKEQLEQLIFTANEQIQNLIYTEEDVKALFDFKQKFHVYSLRNQALIDKQFKGAYAVGSFKFWKDHGFSVKAKEKGINILIPTTITYFQTETGETKKISQATKEEKEKIKGGQLKTRQVNSYGKGHVWDISQTTATEKDLPKLFPNRWTDKTVEDYEIFYQGLEKVADRFQIKIIEPPYELGVVKGISIPSQRAVALNPRNGELQNVKTLIHELAHAKLHTLETRKNYTKQEREFQAELVSYGICSNYGLDTSEYALPYMKSWVRDSDIPKRTKLLAEVYDTCVEYIKVIDQHLVEKQILNVKKQSKVIENEEIKLNSEIRSVSNHMNNLPKEKKELFEQLVDTMLQVADEELEHQTNQIQLKDCGVLLRHFALESIHAQEEMYFCEIENFEDLLEDGTITRETWEEFLRDLEKFKLVENGYLELHTDLETFEQDKDQIDCVMTGYMDFWKQFEQDSLVNNKFPNKEFRKVIVENVNHLFPDENFRKAILTEVFQQDKMGENTDLFYEQLPVIQAQEVLLISNSKIKDLTGIEQFTSLKHLDVSYNPIQVLKGVNEECRKIYAHSTHLNELKNEDIPKEIKTLDVAFCQLKSLDVSNRENLQFLFSSYNQLEDLKFKGCDQLTYLTCQNNKLFDLPLQELSMLEQLDCQNNFLHDLEVPDSMTWLSCSSNQLSELKLNHCTDLEHLECAFNNLEVLEIQELENLKNIDCRGNERSPHELIQGGSATTEHEQEHERSY